MHTKLLVTRASEIVAAELASCNCVAIICVGCTLPWLFACCYISGCSRHPLLVALPAARVAILGNPSFLESAIKAQVW